MRRTAWCGLMIAALFLMQVLLPPAAGAAEGSKIILDADRVLYHQETGVAEAEGSVHLRNEETQIYAPRMEYRTDEQMAFASAKEGGTVTIFYGPNKFTGDTLQYDLASREGVLTNATGDIPAGMRGGIVFLRGKDLSVAPFNTALERKWMARKYARKVTDTEGLVAKWDDVALTTCIEDHPHYHLTTKRLVVIPGVRVIARTPRVYLGGRFIFSYPFDYVVSLREKERLFGVFIPSVVYDKDKGIGYSLAGPYAWDRGQVNMAFRYWSKVDFEARVGVSQRVGSNTSAFAWWDYSYDKDLKEKESRAAWGVNAWLNRWTASLVWSWREKLEIAKDFGTTYRNVLNRMPELTLSSPWFTYESVPGFSWRVQAYWGDYETRRRRKGFVNSSQRFVGDIQAQYIVRKGDIRPFWRGQYRYFTYSESNARGNDQQEIFSSWLGLRTHIGDIDLAVAWFIQDVTGRSPMSWDYAGDREILYGELGFPLGRNFYVSALAAYDLKRSRMGEIGYRMVLDYDCTRWELIYRDDMVGDKDWVSLRFVVKAFPETPYVFGDEALSNPFPSQGTFKKVAEKPSHRPQEAEEWGDDGLTGKKDSTVWEGSAPDRPSGDGAGSEGTSAGDDR